MATPKQIQANRRNSRKSTGPRSVQGKLRSAQNALKSGIDAESQIIPGESQSALAELTREYHDRYRPTTPAQRLLVDTLIHSEWLLRRFRLIETQLWQAALPNPGDDPGAAFASESQVFARLQRRMDSTLRSYRNALRDLQSLQACEDVPELESDPAVTSANYGAKPEIGFVPQIALVSLQPAPPDAAAHPPATPSGASR